MCTNKLLVRLYLAINRNTFVLYLNEHLPYGREYEVLKMDTKDVIARDPCTSLLKLKIHSLIRRHLHPSVRVVFTVAYCH